MPAKKEIFGGFHIMRGEPIFSDGLYTAYPAGISVESFSTQAEMATRYLEIYPDGNGFDPNRLPDFIEIGGTP